jgi:hypothetical protein
VESFELWTGPQLRYAGILLFDLVRIGGSVTFGLSAATASIGAELQREIEYSANARLYGSAFTGGPEPGGEKPKNERKCSRKLPQPEQWPFIGRSKKSDSVLPIPHRRL